MIVLHPNSVCDVCLESYGGTNVPHAVACGHIFCLRCLGSLTRLSCPLCRTPFDAEDIRKLHMDVSTSMPSPKLDERSATVRQLRTSITHIVLEGAPNSDVLECIDTARNWLETQPNDLEEIADLRAASILLFKYYKAKDKKIALAEAQQECEQLKEELFAQKETAIAQKDAAEARYQELSQKRVAEMEKAIDTERKLREQYDRMDQEWRGKYDACLAQCRQLTEELKRTKHNILPRPLETRYQHSPDRDLSNAEAMTIVKEDEEDNTLSPMKLPNRSEDRFQLSPIPATATLPLSSLPNRPNFRPITAEESDVEDLKTRRNNSYFLRHIDPLPMRPGVYRRESSPSLHSRSEADAAASRPIPRTPMDIQMASCSSSPNQNAFQAVPKERVDDPMSGTTGQNRDYRSIRTGSSARRPSVSSITSQVPREQEEQHERWRAQLREVLDTPNIPPLDVPLRNIPDIRRQQSPESSVPTTRQPSPAPIPSNASMYKTNMSPPPVPTFIHNSLLQRPPVSRASTAAMQVERQQRERARDRANSTSTTKSDSNSPTSPPPTSPPRTAATAATREREYEANIYQRHYTHVPHSIPSYQAQQPRRPSMGSLRGKPTPSPAPSVAPASGLARSIWQVQEAQRVS